VTSSYLPVGGRGQGDKSRLPVYPYCVFRGVGVGIRCWWCVVRLCGANNVDEWLVGDVISLAAGGYLDSSTLMIHPSDVR